MRKNFLAKNQEFEQRQKSLLIFIHRSHAMIGMEFAAEWSAKA